MWGVVVGLALALLWRGRGLRWWREAREGWAWGKRAPMPTRAQMTGVEPEGDGCGYAGLVYCTFCQKTHSVEPDEKPCAPGAWIEGGTIA